MILDRLETLSAINFIKDAIPEKSESGRNCLFLRVDEDKLVLTGGGEFLVKKAILIRPNTIEEAARKGKEKTPKTFMIPRGDLFAFAEMMKQHKSECKKMAKNDPSYLFVEIDDTELISYNGKVVYEQPKFEFKDLEFRFAINKDSVSEIPVMSSDMSTAMAGFKKSKPVQVTFTGDMQPIHFQQGDFEALLVPPVEKEGENDQLEIGEDDGDE